MRRPAHAAGLWQRAVAHLARVLRPPPAAKATVAPSKPTAPSPLIAALGTTSTEQNAQPDTVVLLGLDGHVFARATFQPRKAPYIGNAATILQPEAQVGADGVYYMDGSGVVRLLQPSGEPTVVATFPMTPEQRQAWYAASPDGRQLLAGILTYPAIGPTLSGQPWQPLVGTWKFDLEQSDAGGAMHVLQHYESANSPDRGDSFKPIFPVGWTSLGPRRHGRRAARHAEFLERRSVVHDRTALAGPSAGSAAAAAPPLMSCRLAWCPAWKAGSMRR